MYAQLQTAAFASPKGLVEVLQGRGWSGGVIFLPGLIAGLAAALCNMVCLLMGSCWIGSEWELQNLGAAPWALDSGSWSDFVFLLHQEVKLSIAKEINVGACAQRGEEWFAWIMEAVEVVWIRSGWVGGESE